MGERDRGDERNRNIKGERIERKQPHGVDSTDKHSQSHRDYTRTCTHNHPHKINDLFVIKKRQYGRGEK